MPTVEVLVAAMNQHDFSKVHEMNLDSDAVIANQSDYSGVQETSFAGQTIKLVSSTERGVGRNRNLAMLHSHADLCVLADEDMHFDAGYAERVMKAFRDVPQADMLIFNLTSTDGKNTRKRRHNTRIKRVRWYNCLNYGAARIVYRREAVEKAGLSFHLQFGGGCQYSCGEDSLFILSALTKGLKIYTYPISIATIEEGDSTWFEGYTEKYFYDKGCWVSAAFRRFPYLWAALLAVKCRHMNREMTMQKILKIMFRGVRDFRSGTKNTVCAGEGELS